ncbi:MAG TPA: SGNH/GDSL hydrolase family protein [Gaiellaceae bacterium]|nr:SGNH/GDSL hydrolase family protein [Gaiellaceae bacterium]
MARRSGVPGRRTLLLVTVLATLVALGPAAGSAGAVKLTFIGDSKAAAIEYSTQAKRLLARGHTVRRDLKVCRRLVAQGCVYQGVRPLTALQAVRYYGTGLGTVLVVDVGYNDSSATYRKQMETVVRAAKTRGVKGIVWVNLRVVPAHPDYRKINAIIAEVATRRPIIYVANWNAYTRDKPASWFGRDGIHLTGAGAVGLVRLVRKYIPLAAQGPRETVAREVAAGLAAEPEAAPAETPTTATDADDTELTASSPPVGPNLGGPGGGSTGLSGFLPFAGSAALMLFLVLVTVKRRRVA